MMRNGEELMLIGQMKKKKVNKGARLKRGDMPEVRAARSEKGEDDKRQRERS